MWPCRLWFPPLCMLPPLPRLGRAGLVQPAGTRQLQSSPEVPEDGLLPSLLLAEARGGGGNYPWRSHGIQLEAAWLSVSSSVCETDAWLRASYAEQPKREGGNKKQNWMGRILPIPPPSRCLLPCSHSFTAASSCSLALKARRSPAYIRHMPCKNESVIKAFKDDASTTDTHVSSAWDRQAAEKTLYE